MNLLDYLPHNATKRLTEEQVSDLQNDLFDPSSNQLVYAIDVSENMELWVLKGEENDCHLWEIQYQIEYVGEFARIDHAILFSRALEYSMHDILDQLNAALKAKHPH